MIKLTVYFASKYEIMKIKETTQNIKEKKKRKNKIACMYRNAAECILAPQWLAT